MGEALAVNTTLTDLNLGYTFTVLDLDYNRIGAKGASAIAQALAVNKALTSLNLDSNGIGDKGARKIAKALQVNHVLTTLHLDCQGLDEGLLAEVDRFVAVNRALDSKLVAVMMSMHARLGAASGLRVLDQNLVRTICDMFCRESKASCLLDDVEEEDAESDEEEGESDEEEEAEDGEKPAHARTIAQPGLRGRSKRARPKRANWARAPRCRRWNQRPRGEGCRRARSPYRARARLVSR